MVKNQNPGVSSTEFASDTADQPKMAHLADGIIADVSTVTSASPYDSMCKAIRDSGRWMMAWIVFSLLQPNLSWAAVLVVVTLMSFYFFDVAAMFLVYSGLLFYAAVSNLISSETGWIFMAMMQIVFGILSIKEYRLYRTAKADKAASSLTPESSSRLPSHREGKMAWLALLLALIGLVGLCGVIPVGLVLYYQPGKQVEDVITTLMEIIWELSILGIPVGIAALSINRRIWWPAVAGIAVGALTILLIILLATVGD